MKRHAFALLCSLALVGSQSASAQLFSESRIAVSYGPQKSRADSTTRSQKIFGRTIIGMGSMVAVGLVGGWAGYRLELAMAGSNCHEFCGVGGALLGATAGGLIGTAVGVSLPFASQCERSARFGRALGGAVVGAMVGGVAGVVLGRAPVLAIPVVATAPALTAAILQGDC